MHFIEIIISVTICLQEGQKINLYLLPNIFVQLSHKQYQLQKLSQLLMNRNPESSFLQKLEKIFQFNSQTRSSLNKKKTKIERFIE
jgi:hypothetical protein